MVVSLPQGHVRRCSAIKRRLIIAARPACVIRRAKILCPDEKGTNMDDSNNRMNNNHNQPENRANNRANNQQNQANNQANNRANNQQNQANNRANNQQNQANNQANDQQNQANNQANNRANRMNNRADNNNNDSLYDLRVSPTDDQDDQGGGSPSGRQAGFKRR
jgi:hypothetical protein